MAAYLLPGVSVVQPPHLEGDPVLATEILPGPPSLISVQQSANRRDPKKPTAPVFSYLPTSDPGTTYSGLMAGTLTGNQEIDGSRRKRARIDKGATGRAQRASARSLNAVNWVILASDPPVLNEASSSQQMLDSDSFVLPADSDEPSATRSNSGFNLQEGSSSGTGGRPKGLQRDKGKGKEVEPPPVRIKEEPKTVSLYSPEPALSVINDDHCSSCRSQGALVYCDGCPRAFHFWCLDPPMEAVDIPEGDMRWFCPSCTTRKNPPPKPPPSFISPLIHHVQTNIPSEFQLPDDIRTFFKDVLAGPRGAYLDGAEIKQPRLNRHGQLEDRDPYRLKDRNGTAVLCFRCGMSSLPGGIAAAVPSAKRARGSSKATSHEAWKSIVSCDHCSLHWHLDCLDPPLQNVPSFGKKWMCPNHTEQIFHPKRRIPKQNAPLIEISKPNQFNNGNIEVIHPQTSPTSQNKVVVDEVLINGRRYRVPERIIRLDFWSKVNKVPNPREGELDVASGMSSPLTSLSSLEDTDECEPVIVNNPLHNSEDLGVAQLLCSFRDTFGKNVAPSNLPTNGTRRTMKDCSVQAEPVELRSDQTIVDRKRNSGFPKRGPKKANKHANIKTNESMTMQGRPSSSTAKRKKSSSTIQTEPRELRSHSKNMDLSMGSVSSKSSGKRPEESVESMPFIGSSLAKARPSSFAKPGLGTVRIKVETGESEQTTMINGWHAARTGSSSIVSSAAPLKLPSGNSGRRSRNSRRHVGQELEENEREENGKEETKKERVKKRKERDEAEAEKDQKERREDVDRANKTKKEKSKKEKIEWVGREKEEGGRRKSVRTPNRLQPTTLVTPTPAASTTPSLKIRLPRLSSVNLQTNPSPPLIPSLNFGSASHA